MRAPVFLASVLCVVLPLRLFADGQPPEDADVGEAAERVDAKDDAQARLTVLPGFEVEHLYSTKQEEGSWVCMCVDALGRLIVADERGALYRLTPPAAGEGRQAPTVERIPVEIGDAQGLLWAFDSLYVVVNSLTMPCGLYRVRDSDGDGELDEVRQLRGLDGNGEHGPHAVVLAPDQKSLYVVCGNQTKLAKCEASCVPLCFGEDHLLPRMPDGNGFMRGVLGPGGAVYRVDPDGKHWELYAVGLRNAYDAAFNHHGDLFTFDADMEWDFGTPWYRPTRVCLVTSGAEFGWRNGAGKWPPYYPDSLPAVVDIGPGSPTGVAFGYGAKFPAQYQQALFLGDWSFGKLYAVHLESHGAGYTATVEEFLSGTPLQITDIVVRPEDGAMYIVTGGRGTQSDVYRVTYVGAESTAAFQPNEPIPEARALRRRLERFHGRQDPEALDEAWPFLGHADRYVRFAARVAIEHQPASAWRGRALAEQDAPSAIEALLALIRVTAHDPAHQPNRPPVDDSLKADIVEAVLRIDWAQLTDAQRLSLLRVYHILFSRLGPPSDTDRERVLRALAPHYPAKMREQNAELCQLLVYLEAPNVAGTTLELLVKSPTREEQLEYARALRVLKTGWTIDQRQTYFSWLAKASPPAPRRAVRGFFRSLQARRSEPGDPDRLGASLAGFMTIIREDALATLTPEEQEALQALLEAPAEPETLIVAETRPVVKVWTVDELVAISGKGMVQRDFDRGRELFGAANCFACHRFAGEGGAQGPDLTSVAARFNVKDLLTAIVEPSRTISDQYQATVIQTRNGQAITGRLVDRNSDPLQIQTEPLNPSAVVSIPRDDIEIMEPSKVSIMPNGLLNTLHEDEVLDLLAFLLSRGDRDHAMFKK